MKKDHFIRKDMVDIHARINREQYLYCKKNNINISKLLSLTINRLMPQLFNDFHSKAFDNLLRNLPNDLFIKKQNPFRLRTYLLKDSDNRSSQEILFERMYNILEKEVEKECSLSENTRNEQSQSQKDNNKT